MLRVPTQRATQAGLNRGKKWLVLGSVDGHWKVPFRQVYCESFRDMLKQTIWCHVVLRLFPDVVDLAQAPLDRQHFLRAYEWAFRRAEWGRVLKLGLGHEKEEAAKNLAQLGTPECPYKYGYR